MKKIIQEGITQYKATCSECGARFTYEREDVHHNYIHGGDYVSCPSCGQSCRHFGASGSAWPGCGGSGSHSARLPNSWRNRNDWNCQRS